METSHTQIESAASASRLNWLRAAVLGSNDGIVSIAALLVGVAGATDDLRHILIAGVAGILAGALSMAVGEYVSVSSQRDTEEALIEKEKYELEHFAAAELEELTQIYVARGLSRPTAEAVARELTAKDALVAHAEAELGITIEEMANPWHAAIASAASFFAGAVVPLVAITVPPADLRIPIAFVAVFFCLIATGMISAWVSQASYMKVTARVVGGGILAMIITFGIGRLFGVESA